MRSHYRHFHKNFEITGRQIRLNSRVFARFSQFELDEEIRISGDLTLMLSHGLEKYQNEQNAQKEAAEQQHIDLNALMPPPRRSKQKASVRDHSMGISPVKIESRVETLNERIEITPDIKNVLSHIENTDLAVPDDVKPVRSAHHIESVFFDDDFDNISQADVFPQMEEAQGQYGNARSVLKAELSEVHSAVETKDEPRVDVKAEQIDCSSPGGLGETHADDDQSSLAARASRNRRQNPNATEERANRPSRYIPSKGECFACGQCYNNREHHLRKCHPEVERPFECFICRRNYKKLHVLRSHMLVHSNTRNVICHICGSSYFNTSDMKKHIISAHTTGKHFDIITYSKRSLITRLFGFFSLAERPFSCEQCGKSFKAQYALTLHMRLHTGVKPFQCNVCLVTFAAAASLRTHMRRHTGEKPFVCKYCGKAFSDSSTHKQHERMHSGDKPYKCHLCDRRTVQAGNLKSHYRHCHKLIVKNVSMYME